MTSKICTKCKVEKSLDEFYGRKNVKDGKQSECKSCLSNRSLEYKVTLSGCLRIIWRTAKHNANRRLEKGRVDAGVFELSLDDVEGLWKKQDGKCYYSNIPMNYDQYNWRVSLERLNPNQGYIKDNVVLTCIEFNSTSIQWSIEKVKNMLNLRKQTPLQFEPKPFQAKKKPQKTHEKITITRIEDVEHFNCNHCKEIKPRGDFHKDVTKGCKNCHSKYEKKRREEPRGALQLLLRQSKNNTKRREIRNTEQRDNTHDIDFVFLVDLYNNQKGLCAYSGIPLQFKCDTDWKMSLERIDALKGYTRDNVCLICLEFNTSDKSIIYKTKHSGSSAWSKEKFALFVEKATEKYNKELTNSSS